MNRVSSKAVQLSITLLAALAMLLATAWVGDDAFITLRVIDNFINGYGLRYNVIERVQVFTHPLWLFFLMPFYALTREAMVTTMLVSVCLSLGALWLLGARIARDAALGCLLILIAVTSRSICHYSTSGLESPLTFILLALFVWQLYQSEKAWIPAGIAGLLLLNRLDLIVLLGPVMAFLLLRTRGTERIKAAAVFVLPVLAWMAFSLIYYGAPFPNTAYAKLGTGYSTVTLIGRGLDYAEDLLRNDPLLALLIAAAVFTALRMRNWPAALMAAGILLYIAYTISIGGDFMSGRFFATPGFLALCLLARATPPRWLITRGWLAVLAGIVVVSVVLVSRASERPITVDEISTSGIADEQRFYYADNGLFPVLQAWRATGEVPIHPWGMAFKDLGKHANELVIKVTGNAGMYGYYGGPLVHIMDPLALTDPFLARLPAIPRARVGHYERGLPPGYVETATQAAPSTDSVPLRPLLHDITLATRAPLLADGRAAAIWRLLSGHYSWVYQAVIYRIRR
jgi:arabinofuranosyltransferase